MLSFSFLVEPKLPGWNSIRMLQLKLWVVLPFCLFGESHIFFVSWWFFLEKGGWWGFLFCVVVLFWVSFFFEGEGVVCAFLYHVLQSSKRP